MDQLHTSKTSKPLIPSELPPEDRDKILESLIFTKEKMDGTIKVRACADGKKQRKYKGKPNSNIPMVSIEAVMITEVIEAKSRSAAWP